MASVDARTNDLARFILAHKDAILSEWKERVRVLPPARRLSHEALLDHVPQLLDDIARLADELALGEEARAAPHEDAETHAIARLAEGFDLAVVVSEYAMLRDCILRLWEEAHAPHHQRVVHHAVDRAISVSIDRFTEARDRTLLALDRVASAALESRDVDDLLNKLLSVLVETSPAIDTAAILLRDGDELRLRASVGREGDVERGFSLRIGEGFAGTIAATGEPRFVASATCDPLVKSDVLRARGVRALFGVPLVHEGVVVGVAHVGSLTADALSEQDRRLVLAMANRATSALVQHMLREAAEQRAAELEAVLESMPDAVLIGDARGVRTCNRRALEVLGAGSAGELQADLSSLVERLDMRDRRTGARMRTDDLGLVRATRGESGVVEIVVRRPSDGADRVLRTAFAPIVRDGGNVGSVVVSSDVTEQRRAAEERDRLLRLEREARADAERNVAVLDAILGASAVGIGLVDRDLRFLRINHALADINERPLDAHVGRTVTEVLGDEGAALEPMLRRVIDEGETVVDLEIATERRPGRRRWFVANYFPVRTRDGRTLGLGAVVLEITARKLAEERTQQSQEALREGDARLRLASEATELGTFDWDLRSGRIHWSERTKVTFGLRPDEEIDLDGWTALLHEDDRARVRAAIDRAIDPRADVGYEAEYRIARRDTGELRWVSARGRAIRDPRGEVVRLIGTAIDVTERRKALDMQRFLAEVTTVLASSLDAAHTLDALAHLAIPRVGDGCAVTLSDETGAIARVAIAHPDPRKVALLRQIEERYPPAPDAPRGTPHVIRTGSPELVPHVDDATLAAIARDEEHLRMLRGLGLRSYMIAPLLARGRVLGAITFAITESGRAYAAQDLELAMQLAARAAIAVDNALLYQEAQREARLREHVLAIVSHDLKNPLSAIHMSAALLLRRAIERDDARSREHLELIQRSSRRMEHLIRDLLDTAGIQAGRLTVEREPHAVDALVEEAVELHSPLAIEKGLLLTADVDDARVEVPCDRDRVLQVLSNLLGNAIKFCRPGESIVVRAVAKDGCVQISVADTGPGIAEQELAHVFEPYWSAVRHRRVGTGLGLFISKGIVEAHGGRLSVESTVGEGTTFTFTLPRGA